MLRIVTALWAFALLSVGPSARANQTVIISGEVKQWHKVTLTLEGPFAKEADTQPNPFTDFAFAVTFTEML